MTTVPGIYIHTLRPEPDLDKTVVMEIPQPERGVKFNQGKPEMSLLDYKFLEEVAKVMGLGKQKYGAFNWKKGLPITWTLDAAQRHLSALMDSEDHDKESKLSHAAHAACNLMFFYWTLKNKPELDNRYKGTK